MYAYILVCSSPTFNFALAKTIFSEVFPKTLSSAMGLGFMGSFGFGMGWKSWSFQAIGLFLSSYVLFINIPRNNVSAPDPMFAYME